MRVWDVRGFGCITGSERFSTDVGRKFAGAQGTIGSERSFQTRSRRRFEYADEEEVPETKDEELFDQASSGIDYSKYEEINVSIEGETPAPPADSFKDLNLNSKIMRNVLKLGYSDPTPIQKHAIPNAVNNRDIMACAQTGSGKTAAFLIPIMNRILASPDFAPVNSRGGNRRAFGDAIQPLALVLAPTRELCRQIHEEARKFSYRTGISASMAYGGQSRQVQLRQMSRGCHILIATPGRLNDFLQSRAVSMSKICYLALDEADRMLDMGFAPQIEDIVIYSDMTQKEDRQTMVFSATFPSEIQKMASQYLNQDYIFITVGRVGSTTDLITQDVRFVQDFAKQDALLDILPELKQAIIFCRTKSEVDRLERFLFANQQKVSSIHGDKSQNARDRALFNFKQARTNIMVATDVAARGLDIPNVSHVINYDTPNNIDEYVHRIGRTGRAGKKGVAISFINGENVPVARELRDLLVESKQQVPEELEDLCNRRGRGGSYPVGRRGRGGEYRGRDGGSWRNRGVGRREGGRGGDRYGRRGGGYGRYEDRYGTDYGRRGERGGYRDDTKYSDRPASELISEIQRLKADLENRQN